MENTIDFLENTIDTKSFLEKGDLKLLHSLFVEATRRYFRSSYDLGLSELLLKETVEKILSEERKERDMIMRDRGVPEGLLKLRGKGFAIMKYEGDYAKGIRGLTVTSSRAPYFSPWTGKVKGEDKEEIIKNRASKMDNTYEGSATSDEVEKLFFSFQYEDIDGYVRRNPKKVAFNPDLPFLSSRPDGYVIAGQGQAVAVVEVKLRTGETKSLLQKGSQIYTQLYVQMLTSRLQKAYLATTNDHENFQIEVLHLDPSEAQTVVANLFEAYTQVVAELDLEDIKFKESLLIPRKGKPKQKVSGIKKIFDDKKDWTAAERTMCNGSSKSPSIRVISSDEQ